MWGPRRPEADAEAALPPSLSHRHPNIRSRPCLPPLQEVPTLRQLWARGQQVVLSYDDACAVGRHRELWPAIPYWWGNQVKAPKLVRYLERMQSCGRPGGWGCQAGRARGAQQDVVARGRAALGCRRRDAGTRVLPCPFPVTSHESRRRDPRFPALLWDTVLLTPRPKVTLSCWNLLRSGAGWVPFRGLRASTVKGMWLRQGHWGPPGPATHFLSPISGW